MELIEEIFIFNIKKFEEFDAIINCINFNGKKINLRAKGFFKEKSKNALVFKEFCFVNAEYIKSDFNDDWGLLKRGDATLNFVVEKDLDIYFVNIFKNIFAYNDNYSCTFFKNLRKIIENLINKPDFLLEIYFLLIQFLKKINGVFTLEKCVICKQNKKIKTFSIYDGGLICKDCFNKTNHNIYSIETLKKIIFLFNCNNLKQFLEIDLNTKEIFIIKSILKNYYENQLGFYLNDLDKI